MQIDTEDEFSRYLRLRWTRGDGDRYIRQDAARYLKPAYPEKKYAAFHECRPSSLPIHQSTLDDLKFRCELASLRLDLALLRFSMRAQKALHHSNFQPRVPAGTSDGGQWAAEGAQGGRTRVAVRDPQTIIRMLGRLLQPRLGMSRAELDSQRHVFEALQRVRDLDGEWLPTDLSSNERIIQQAEQRLAEFADLPPDKLIATFRERHGIPDLFDPARSEDRGVVAVSKFEGQPVFGVNSGGPGYKNEVDRVAADNMRDILVERYPDLIKPNIGQIPNDAMYHAEATVLLRLAKMNGGSLHGREIEVHVDDIPCARCEIILPRLGWELGNPAVTFVNTRTGERQKMRDLSWIPR